MTPYAITEGFIKPYQLAILEEVRKAVANMPDGLNCHQVCCRIAEETLDLDWVKGKFNHWDHSWLSIRGTRLVIDAYPWACGSGPIIVDCQTGSPWATLYKEQHENLVEETPNAFWGEVPGGVRASVPQDDQWEGEQSPYYREGGD